MNSFTLADCTTVEAALSQLKDGAVVKAGGVDLLDRMKNGTDTPARLVNIRNIPSLRGIQVTQQGLTIGPLTTLTEVSGHPIVRAQYAVLSDACGHAATPHIRNMATLGGNLLQRLQCWYFRSAEFECLRKGKEICFAFSGLNQYHAIMDYGGCPSVAPSSGAVALLALDANLELTSAAKGKRMVPIREFYVHPDANPQRYHVMGPDELLTAIYVPKPATGTRSAYQKYGEKESNDWAIADAGIVLEMDVRRSQEAEAVLTGKTITPELARAAGQASMHGAMPLSMNAYKVQLFPVAIYRTVLLAAGQMGRDPSAAS
jgi:xanthine dehydrogenase YagS FAD-binding subunit